MHVQSSIFMHDTESKNIQVARSTSSDGFRISNKTNDFYFYCPDIRGVVHTLIKQLETLQRELWKEVQDETEKNVLPTTR